MATSSLVLNGITPTLKILGDTQSLNFSDPTGTFALKNSSVPTANAPNKIVLEFLNNLLNGYLLKHTTNTGEDKGTLTLESLLSASASIVLTINNGQVTFATAPSAPLPTQDDQLASKKYVDQRTPSSTLKSVLQGYVSAGYTTNVAAGDYIKFNAVNFSQGSNISLNTTSAYTKTLKINGLGRITLAGGNTYKITSFLSFYNEASKINCSWVDVNTGLNLSLGAVTNYSGAKGSVNPYSFFFAPVSTTRIAIKMDNFTYASSGVIGAADTFNIGVLSCATSFIIEQV